MKKEGFGAGIHILVKRDGKFLVLKRSLSDSSDPGCWDLPGGGIRYKEKPLDAARREAREEAGIEINVIGIIDMWGKMFEGTWSMESLVSADYITGEVALSKEHCEYKWVSKEELEVIEPKASNLKALFNINESLIGILNIR